MDGFCLAPTMRPTYRVRQTNRPPHARATDEEVFYAEPTDAMQHYLLQVLDAIGEVCCALHGPLRPEARSTKRTWQTDGLAPIWRLVFAIPISNYQMAPSERGAGGGSATHKEPT